MKKVHWFFFVLKFFLLAQFGLVFIHKHTVESVVYIATELMFKLSLGLFIEYFLFTRDLSSVDPKDKVILSFAGGILMYDALVNDLPHLLSKYNIRWNMPFLREYK